MSGIAPRDILRVEDLRIAFPLIGGTFNAVDGASLRVQPGKITALVGESGSGKTVTSQAVLGLQPAIARVSGRILFSGTDGAAPVDLLRLPKDGRAIREIRGGQIGTIFQEPMTSFSPLHTIGNQISEALRIHRLLPPKQVRDDCIEMLGRVGFADPAKVYGMYPFELSGGMRQRAMIAMALICRPALLIADEPTTALDVTIQAQILALLKELQEDLGMAILLITHDLGIVAGIADEVYVMYRGEIVEAGSVGTLFHEPRHPYMKGLLGAVPSFELPPGERLRPLREIPVGNADGLRSLIAGGRPAAAPLARVRLAHSAATVEEALAAVGAMPLPPYIAAKRPADEQDRTDYQTVFARHSGAVAAPTASLHFDEALLETIRAKGVEFTEVTLHVGAGTFLPVKVDDPTQHRMHAEWGEVSETAAAEIRATKAAGGRVIAVGTTALRLIESAARQTGEVQAFAEKTDIFIYPGFEFRAADGLMTNFHLPKSTLMMLVSALMGRGRMMSAYAHAVAAGYRFFSYGDASLLLPSTGK